VVNEQVLSRVISRVETQLTEEHSPDERGPLPLSQAHAQRGAFTRYSTSAPRYSGQSAKFDNRGSIPRLETLNKILHKLQIDSDGIEASALISEDGLMIASALPPGMEEVRVAGMAATLLNLGSRGALELNRGGVEEIIVRGDRGYAVLLSAGRGALLLALTSENAKLGLVFFDMREAVSAVQKVL
jgi:predicted regulator of Ras-like GTPase activity (Roadblock/LC7/MglB family)